MVHSKDPSDHEGDEDLSAAEHDQWRFNDPPDTGVFTTTGVLNGDLAVVLVAHDHDGDWQFLCGTTQDVDEPENGALVCLADMIALDGSLNELADLPDGWRADRDDRDDEWERSPLDLE